MQLKHVIEKKLKHAIEKKKMQKAAAEFIL